MAWMPVVSVQFVVLEPGRVVWATGEEDGVGGTRWTLWHGGRRFTIRDEAQTFEHTHLDPGWLSGAQAPLAARPLGNETYRVELNFYRSTHIASASGTTRMTFYLRTMTVRESVRSVGVSLNDHNANATATGTVSWPPGGAMAGQAQRLDPDEVPPMRKVSSAHLGFTIEASRDPDDAALQSLLANASRSCLVRVGHWRVAPADPAWAPDPGMVASVVCEAAGCGELEPADRARCEMTAIDAEKMAWQYLHLGGAMRSPEASAGARLFLSRCSTSARYYLIERLDGDLFTRAVLAVDRETAAVLCVFERAIDPH